MPFGSRQVSSTSGGSFFQTSMVKEEQARGAILPNVSQSKKVHKLVMLKFSKPCTLIHGWII